MYETGDYWLVTNIYIFIYLEDVWTLREKNVKLKKEKKIFSKQFVMTEPTKYGLRKKTF